MTARRALVLGGGGVTGIGWMTGLLAGLAEAGTDLTLADLVVGTSAGSVVGAQILSGATLRDLYATQLTEPCGRATTGPAGRALAAPQSGLERCPRPSGGQSLKRGSRTACGRIAG